MDKEANTRLADLFALTGWSKGELARLVNRQAAAMGHPQLATDTSRVRRWIDTGESPREPVPTVLAALFTERLGRVVTIEDLGFGRHRRTGRKQSVSADGLPWPPERTAAVLTEFTGMDLMLNRRGLVGAGAALAAGSALSSAMYDWLHTDPALAADAPTTHDPFTADAASYDRYEAAPVGSQEIEALERSVEVFRAWDASRGGGLQRKAVVGQLNEVGGMLAYQHPPHLKRRLWGVAANLAVLAGWMSHDVGLEPTAQKYFVIAAHAAREGGDRPRAGEALTRRPADGPPGPAGRRPGPDEAGAVRLRARDPAAHPGHALHHRGLGTGLHGARPGDAPHPRQGRGPLRHRPRRRPPPSWMQMFDEADLHGMQALAYRTLAEHEPLAARTAQQHAKQALELRDKGRDRSNIFDYISLASACFIADDPEQADRYARLALLTIRQNSSLRTWDRLREMYRLTARYSDFTRIQDLREEIEIALPSGPQRRGPVI